MDLNQRKLTKAEWDSIEQPVSQEEKKILQLIIDGYSDVNIHMNYHLSLFGFLKIEYNEVMEDYLFNKYFLKKIEATLNKMEKTMDKELWKQLKEQKPSSNTTIKKADSIRLQKNTEELLEKADIYENVLLFNIDQMIKFGMDEETKEKKSKSKELKKKHHFEFYYFTLYKLSKNHIIHLNRHIVKIVEFILNFYKEKISFANIIENAVEYIEKNTNLLKYSDMVLYEHQKEIFTIFNRSSESNLVLYIAPTGTGKTLTPIALSQKQKIIFVCAARHVGISLARYAISMNKKIAFAFGCSSAEDIRLHYFAASDYTKDWRTGGIRKVDNSAGEKVEIIICDIKSYLPAMYYMCSFNEKQNIITYWDEPTITMDYENHEIHAIIQKNWTENLIPNMVLSSATLPKIHELTDVIADFKEKFPEAQIHNIVSHDCKKSIPMINNNGYVILPHYLSDEYEEVVKIAKNCENYLTLLRYFDLKEVVEFISYVVIQNNYASVRMKIDFNFESLDDITMKNIKLYYLKVLKNISGGTWGAVLLHFKINRKPRIIPNHYIDIKGNKIPQKSISIGGDLNHFSIHQGGLNIPSSIDGKPIMRSNSDTSFMMNPGIGVDPNHKIISQKINGVHGGVHAGVHVGNCAVYVTTKDAFTLTDGPTIFLANDVEKIAKFCIQQANIPALVMDDIMKKIEFNNSLNEKIDELERELEFLTDKSNSTSSLSTKDGHKLRKENRESSFETKDNKNGNSISGGGNKLNQMKEQIITLKNMIRSVSLNDTFVPNTTHHLKKWAEEMNVRNAFTSRIDEDTINEIMLLNGVDDNWKILLMMGIGVFSNTNTISHSLEDKNSESGEKRNGRYIEIMKRLADEQRLYMIIASSDYIYGTNYQFCHGYLSKDLNLTQEKIIQSMGRIGRSNVQQDYTIRFRDDEQIRKLFEFDANKPEVRNMNRLLTRVYQ